MNLSTLKIEEELNKYLEAAYPALYKEYILFTIVMMIACVIIPMFIIRILGQRTYRDWHSFFSWCCIQALYMA